MKGTAPHTPDTKPHSAQGHLSGSAPGKYLGIFASRLPTSTTAGATITIGGLALALAICFVIDRWVVPLTNPGWFFLPVVALGGYRWGWRLGLFATLGEVLLIWCFFTPPRYWQGLPNGDSIARLLSLTGGTLFVLALVDLAARQQQAATTLANQNADLFRQEAERREHVEALNQVGAALSSELDKERLLHLIAQTARDLTGAGFAAFTLRPEDGSSQRFHLAAAVGLSPQQEATFRRMPLGGEGVLAPIYQEQHLVRVGDATTDARAIGQPRGHLLVRSFLGAPLLGRDGRMLGGLLLGHSQPDQFTAEHEALLKGLAAQASVALENARLFEQARQRAEELEAVIEGMVDGVALHNAKGKLVRQNRAALQMAESTSTSIATLLMQEVAGVRLCTADGAPLALEERPARRALAGETIHSTDLHVAWETGAEWEINVSAAPLHGQEQTIEGAVTVFRDLTVQRRQEREARLYTEVERRRRLLQTVLDELPSGVFIVEGEDSRLTLANRAAEATWGVRWQAAVAASDFFRTSGVRISQIDGRPMPIEQLACVQVFRQEEPIRYLQEVIRRPDGTSLPVLVNAVKFPWLREEQQQTSSEPFTGHMAAIVMQDISALKEAERLKDEFVALVSHELKNPLTSIKGYAQLLRAQFEAREGLSLSEQERLCLQVVEEEADRLSALASDVIDVSRLQSGRLVLRIDELDLVALVRQVAERLQITTKEHTLKLTTDHDSFWLYGDRNRLEQVLLNLLGNAIKYTPQGGCIDITIAQTGDGQSAQVRIHDTGIGIPREQQARLFARFSRASNAAAHGITGTGLGLFLCRELIERHGGRIWLQSEEGQGSTFFFTLPLTSPEEAGEP
ncbi:MAG TPA: ATP-binding protein [Ktedonobacterales bacterium]|jgi:signal transduction histidine kinase